MGERAKPHLDAADRHRSAAATHERVASFWDGRGDAERSELQREMADYERHGADLELRWAELVDRDALRDPIRGARSLRGRMADGVRQLSEHLLQMAQSLERAADIADERSEGLERAGRVSDLAEERQAAQFARAAAQRAHSQAEQWLRLLAERHT